MNELNCEQLPSKKNNVYRQFGELRDSVVKIFSKSSRFQMEKEMVDLLQDSGLLIPERLAVDEKELTVVYKYIDGDPVVDLLEIIELTQAVEIIRKICDWLVKFYAITLEKMGCQYILGDIHLRNFIYAEVSGLIYGLDFEECRPGRIETDVARLWVFILHYDPAFTQRKKTLAYYLQETLFAALVLDENFFQQEVERETAELLARRSARKGQEPLAL